MLIYIVKILYLSILLVENLYNSPSLPPSLSLRSFYSYHSPSHPFLTLPPFLLSFFLFSYPPFFSSFLILSLSLSLSLSLCIRYTSQIVQRFAKQEMPVYDALVSNFLANSIPSLLETLESGADILAEDHNLGLVRYLYFIG